MRLLLLLTVCAALRLVFEGAEAADGQRQRRRRNRKPGARRRGGHRRPVLRPAEFVWVCPRVRCLPVEQPCARVESFVVNVLGRYCESCPYCIERGARSRRHLDTAGQPLRQTGEAPAGFEHDVMQSLRWTPNYETGELCPPDLDCPPTHSPCDVIELRHIWISGVRCRRCPVCFGQPPQPHIET